MYSFMLGALLAYPIEGGLFPVIPAPVNDKVIAPNVVGV
jgi:hypothetical protein